MRLIISQFIYQCRLVVPFCICLILVSIINLQAQESDSVTVRFEVEIPTKTPSEDTIFWTGDLNNWDPGNKGSGFSPKELAKPLSKTDGNLVISVTGSKGDTVSYKYTRGSMFSVEEKADLTYREPRKVVFDNKKVIRDTVVGWHDIPPKSIQDRWPKIILKEDSIPIVSGEKLMDGSGTMLYDLKKVSRFFDVTTFYTNVESLPYEAEHVNYFLKLSDAPDNTVLVTAIKQPKHGLWTVYADQNNDNSIASSEKVFSVFANQQGAESWEGKIAFQQLDNGKVVESSVKMNLSYAPEVPRGYSSSVHKDAPDLTYKLPFKIRKGSIQNNSFYVVNEFKNKFSEYFWIGTDQNGNDSLNIGSGSAEVDQINLNQMYREQKFFIHPGLSLGDSYWQVANIQEDGKWIRLRPKEVENADTKIVKGKKAPRWNAKTIQDKRISSTSMRGKYVLLDFWGSWCGPCIKEIPILQSAYKKFNSPKFEIVGFAYDSKCAFKAANRKYNLKWPQVLDSSGKYSKKFLVTGYPTHYLIGPNGKVLEKGDALSSNKLIETLSEYLK